MAAALDQFDADVPARGRAADRRATRKRCVWPPRGARAVAQRREAGDESPPQRLHSAAQSDERDGPHRTGRDARGGFGARAGAGDRSRVRPAPQDAAPEPEERARCLERTGNARDRFGAPRRNAERRGIRRGGPGTYVNRMPVKLAALLAGAAFPAVASAQDTGSHAEQIVVVANPGGDIDFDDAIALDRDDIARSGRPALLGALTRDIAGVTLQDAQNNPWQPNLIYRGFIASPLQGQSQGLAVYLDGGRFNQPFGDTVDFDLIPDAALHRATLLDASPAYGLNALGGTLGRETATGRSDHGLAAAISLGSYGERQASLSGGGATGAFSYFGAFQYRREHGWRDYSHSELTNGYAGLGFDEDWGGVPAKFVAADTALTGNGVSPVELLATRRASMLPW